MDLKNRFESLDEKVDLRAASAGVLLISGLLVFSQVDSRLGGQGQGFEVNLTVQKPSENISKTVEVTKGSTVFSALNSSFEISYSKDGRGYTVESVEDISQNGSYYWMHFVNGEAPDVGSGEYVLERGDSITFRYISQSRAMEIAG